MDIKTINYTQKISPNYISLLGDCEGKRAASIFDSFMLVGLFPSKIICDFHFYDFHPGFVARYPVIGKIFNIPIF